MVKIATTHVGSLPRMQKVVDFLFARERVVIPRIFYGGQNWTDLIL